MLGMSAEPPPGKYNVGSLRGGRELGPKSAAGLVSAPTRVASGRTSAPPAPFCVARPYVRISRRPGRVRPGQLRSATFVLPVARFSSNSGLCEADPGHTWDPRFELGSHFSDSPTARWGSAMEPAQQVSPRDVRERRSTRHGGHGSTPLGRRHACSHGGADGRESFVSRICEVARQFGKPTLPNPQRSNEESSFGARWRPSLASLLCARARLIRSIRFLPCSGTI